jgi:hypothetical protein
LSFEVGEEGLGGGGEGLCGRTLTLALSRDGSGETREGEGGEVLKEGGELGGGGVGGFLEAVEVAGVELGVGGEGASILKLSSEGVECVGEVVTAFGEALEVVEGVLRGC